jgi:hypothetical protein
MVDLGAPFMTADGIAHFSELAANLYVHGEAEPQALASYCAGR